MGMAKISKRRKEYYNKLGVYFANGDNIFPKPMNDSEFRKFITDYLLGENWYQANPVSQEQCNVYIADAIIDLYKSKVKSDE